MIICIIIISIRWSCSGGGARGRRWRSARRSTTTSASTTTTTATTTATTTTTITTYCCYCYYYYYYCYYYYYYYYYYYSYTEVDDTGTYLRYPGVSAVCGKGQMGSALMGSLRISCFLTEGLFGYSRSPTFISPKVPGRSFFPNLSKLLASAVDPLH